MSRLNLTLLAACALFATNVMAAEPSVTITAPADGAKLDAMEQNKIVYDVVPGPKGDHTHLYVDGKEVAILRELKGSRTLESLAPGKHAICIKVVNKGHTPIGVEKCVNVSVD
ncbi:MAG: hypothetical protein ABIP61_00355 [Burkholderiaceae bacterium]